MWCRNGSGLIGESNKSKVMGSNPIHIAKQTLKTKPMTKILIQFTLLASFLFFIFYLLGSFTQTTFDISKWSNDARNIIGVFGGFFSLIISGLSVMANNHKI